jgi:hypothetical protein
VARSRRLTERTEIARRLPSPRARDPKTRTPVAPFSRAIRRMLSTGNSSVATFRIVCTAYAPGDAPPLVAARSTGPLPSNAATSVSPRGPTRGRRECRHRLGRFQARRKVAAPPTLAGHHGGRCGIQLQLLRDNAPLEVPAAGRQLAEASGTGGEAAGDYEGVLSSVGAGKARGPRARESICRGLRHPSSAASTFVRESAARRGNRDLGNPSDWWLACLGNPKVFCGITVQPVTDNTQCARPCARDSRGRF